MWKRIRAQTESHKPGQITQDILIGRKGIILPEAAKRRFHWRGLSATPSRLRVAPASYICIAVSSLRESSASRAKTNVVLLFFMDEFRKRRFCRTPRSAGSNGSVVVDFG